CLLLCARSPVGGLRAVSHGSRIQGRSRTPSRWPRRAVRPAPRRPRSSPCRARHPGPPGPRARQLQAVLAHERAHLRCRHHLMLAAAAALARAFPRVPLFAQAGPELGVLAEMAADAAARRHGPDHLAKALVILARAGTRPAALAAGGPAAIARIQRLLAPPRQ